MALATKRSEDTVTTIFLCNLAGRSSVHAIEESLYSLAPSPSLVQVSMASQSVTVDHLESLHTSAIQSALERAGLDAIPIPFVPNDNPTVTTFAGDPESTLESLARDVVVFPFSPDDNESTTTVAADSESAIEVTDPTTTPTNESTTTFAAMAHYLAGEKEEKSNLDNSPARAKGGRRSYLNKANETVKRLSASIKFPSADLRTVQRKPEISAVPLSHPNTPKFENGFGGFTVSISVGGMTCSACSSAITRCVSQLPGVSQVVVDVLGKSATVVVERRDLAKTVTDAIEDCGFDAEVANIEPIGTNCDSSEVKGLRTVSFSVGGMNSPEKVMESLASFGPDISVIQPLQGGSEPILTLSYYPSPPSLTIRTIMSAIASSNSPPCDVSIYYPPSVEQLARRIQAREQRNYLYRLILSVIVAIPTFILGIVYMSLVPKTNPVRLYMMEPMWAGNISRIQWALFVMATPVMFYSANLFHRHSIKEVRALWRKGSTTPILQRFTRFGSMNLLVSTGVSVAYFSSVVLLGLAAAQPASPDGMGDSATYFDSVVFLTMFLLAGRSIESYSKTRTADAVTALASLRPAKALLLVARQRDDNRTESLSMEGQDKEKHNTVGSQSAPSGFVTEEVDVDLLDVGDVVRVVRGATPPADGILVSGDNTAFDESSLTGESKLIKKHQGDKVFLGTINKSEMVDIEITEVGGGSMLDHIVKIVRDGQTRRAPIERVADLLTGFFVPVVTLLAVGTWLIWLTLGLSGTLPRDYLDITIGGWPVWSLQFAIAVFVVACPCGIGLAAPTALLVGSGIAAQFGILARGGGEALQEMAQVDVVVFDKTGTLTEGGEPRVSDAVRLDCDMKLRDDVILGIAAEMESASSHPLSIAIRHYCDTHGATSPAAATEITETAGKGLKGFFDALHCTVIIGNEAWMTEHDVSFDGVLVKKLDSWKSAAKSVVLMAVRDESDKGKTKTFQIAATFSVSDQLRPEAKGVVSHLQENHIGTWMISGDNVTTAQAVARTVGIPATNVIADVLPHEKADKIRWLQLVGRKRQMPRWSRAFGERRLNNRCIVAMVGDGINDAPALTASDVGIAIGSGSDVAISSASFILVSSDLQSLLTLRELSCTVFNRVKFNFLWAVMYNLAAVPIAAGVLYPVGHIRLSPVWASLAMALSSISVVCSSLFLRLFKPPKIRSSAT